MKVGGYTIIEGIVSMVILSIILSVAALVSFNVYQSFPSRVEMEMEQKLSREMDSLVSGKIIEPVEYRLQDYLFRYNVGVFEGMDKIYRVTGMLSDTLGHEKVDDRIFYVDEEN